MRATTTSSCFALLAALCLACPHSNADDVLTSDAESEVIVAKTGAEAAGEACDSSEDCAEKAACDADATAVAAEDQVQEAEVEDREVVYPTHKQTKLISVNEGDLSNSQLRSFCILPNGNILAACNAEQGEVRLFSATGDYLDSWELPFDPEAINVGSDGYIYLAGAGTLLKLSDDGKVVLEAESPHVAMTDEKRERIRVSIIAQQRASVERYEQMASRYEQRYTELDEAVKVLQKNGVTLSDAQQRPLEQAKRMRDQWTQIIERVGAKELTEEQLDQRVAASIKSQSAVASISEAAGEVFIATREEEGYGYCVWRMAGDFTGGEVITTGLRGCCGQMDVQCCENGVYVAENSRHRVYHISRAGEEVGEWGHGAREGLEGFGSCCNPMNVAFGPQRSVYTAESGTGRIKRYTPEGKLIELVGKVDVVPGCKKVSIAVGPNGDRVYMMDITRHHIVMMERLAEGEDSGYSEPRTAQAEEADGDVFETSLSN